MAVPNIADLQIDSSRKAAPRCAAWAAAVVAASCAVASLAGCRHLDNAQVDVLERELRQQENYIYELEDYLIEYSEKLREARLEQCAPDAAAKKSPAGKRPLPEPTLDVDPIERPAPSVNKPEQAPSAIEPPPSGEPSATPQEAAPEGTAAPTVAPDELPPEEHVPGPAAPEEMEIPELEIGTGVGAASSALGDSLAADRASGDLDSDDTLVIPDPVDFQTDANPAGDSLQATAAAEPPPAPLLAAPENGASRMEPERLQIRRVFAESTNADAPDPESLLVIVEALNATDEPVDAVGEASLMIMLRDAPGSLRRIDRWDFTADETQSAWQSSHLGDGLHLELPLHERPLPAGELELWARLVAPDGRKLLTQIPIDPAKLANVDDAADEATPTATAPPAEEATPLKDVMPLNAAAAPPEAAPVEGPSRTWRVSAQASAPGKAATGAEAPAGWIRRAGADEPRTAVRPARFGSPTWQRSASPPQAALNSPWAPDR